jgi:hypoxanthine phosphoribosyltransferase
MVYFDQDEETTFPEGIHDWSEQAISKADAIIIVCSQNLLSSISANRGSRGKNVSFEFRLIRTAFVNKTRDGNNLIPVIMPGGSNADIPKAFEHLRTYQIPSSYDEMDSDYKALLNCLSKLDNSMHQPEQPAPVSTKRTKHEKKVHGTSHQHLLQHSIPVDKQAVIEWDDFRVILGLLHEHLEVYNERPDAVVSVSAEGALVASVYCLNWRIRPLLSIESQFVNISGKPQTQLYDLEIGKLVTAKRILLIDSEMNSGRTIEAARNYLYDSGASLVRTFVLAKHRDSTTMVDYIGFHFIIRPKFPWEWTDAFQKSRHKKPLQSRYK